MWDYKTKWQWYDLRISVTGDTQIDNLANMIENNYYQKGERQELEAVKTELVKNEINLENDTE